MTINSNWLITSASFTVSLFSFCFHDLSIDESGVLRSPTIIVWSTMYFLSFNRVSLNIDAFVFGAYMLRIESSSWQISPVMSKKCPSLYFLITFRWKSTLFDIRMATPACFLGPFAWKVFFPTLLFWDSVCLCLWDEVPVCSKMLKSVYVSSLIAYIFLLWNWVHLC